MLNRIEELEKQLKQISDEIKEIKKQENNMVQLKELQPGETFKIGEHDFVVLEQRPGQTAVISKWFMASGKHSMMT